MELFPLASSCLIGTLEGIVIGLNSSKGVIAVIVGVILSIFKGEGAVGEGIVLVVVTVFVVVVVVVGKDPLSVIDEGVVVVLLLSASILDVVGV